MADDSYRSLTLSGQLYREGIEVDYPIGIVMANPFSPSLWM